MRTGEMMQHKGYVGMVEVDEEAGVIFGRVVGLRDVITFQGATVPEARRAFEESIDSYLKLCASRGEEPDRPFSGKFLVRTPPALHRALSVAAEAQQVSLNTFVQQLLSRGVAEHLRNAIAASAPLPETSEIFGLPGQEAPRRAAQRHGKRT